MPYEDADITTVSTTGTGIAESKVTGAPMASSTVGKKTNYATSGGGRGRVSAGAVAAVAVGLVVVVLV